MNNNSKTRNEALINSYLQNSKEALNLSTDLPMQVFDILKIALKIGFDLSGDEDTNND